MKDFREFLLKQNALALAIGVIIGAAIGKVVSSIVEDVLMPAISPILPSGNWREAQVVLSKNVDAAGKETLNAIKYGHLFGTLIDFVIVALIVYMIGKMFMKPAPPPAVKTCPACLEAVPVAATRCRACTGAL